MWVSHMYLQSSSSSDTSLVVINTSTLQHTPSPAAESTVYDKTHSQSQPATTGSLPQLEAVKNSASSSLEDVAANTMSSQLGSDSSTSNKVS